MKKKAVFDVTYKIDECVKTLEVLKNTLKPVPIAQVVERPLREREDAGSKPGRAIPKALKMVPVATLLGAQHYKVSTGFSHSLLTQLTLHTKKKKKKKKKNYPPTLGSPEPVWCPPRDRKIDR